MTDSLSLRRTLPLLLVIALCACSKPVTSTPPTPKATSTPVAATGARAKCDPDATRHSYAPIVCIDDRSEALTTVPDPVYASNKQREGGGPVIILFMTVTGKKDLTISPKPSVTVPCLQPNTLHCEAGHCSGIIDPNAVDPVTKQRPCGYNVKVGDYPVKDPIVIVDTCCPPN